MEVRDRINLLSLSIIGPVMQLFEAYLGARRPGAWARSRARAEYFKRTAQVLTPLPPKSSRTTAE